jgi:hypothetical protein
MNLIKISLILTLFLSINFVVKAQDPLAGRDLSQIKVESLTETQITQIKKKLDQSGLTIDQVESQAIAKGMSPLEFSKLKERVNGSVGIVMSSKKTTFNSKNQTVNTNQIKDSVVINNSINNLVYGSELFMSNTSGNSANKSLATPLNYEIGPNDVLKLVIFGVQEYSADLTVSKEGKIYVDNVGNIKVGGLTIEAAKSRIKQQMSATAYSSLSRGESKIDLTFRGY